MDFSRKFNALSRIGLTEISAILPKGDAIAGNALPEKNIMYYFRKYGRELTLGYSRSFGIVSAWLLTLWYVLWNNPRVTEAFAPNQPPSTSVGAHIIASIAICLFIIGVGYYRIFEETPARPDIADRSMSGLRALLFLAPTVPYLFACVICATMYLGWFPHQGLGLSMLYTAHQFALHHFLFWAPPLADHLFPLERVIAVPNDVTEIMAYLCRGASLLVMLGAVAPAITDRR